MEGFIYDLEAYGFVLSYCELLSMRMDPFQIRLQWVLEIEYPQTYTVTGSTFDGAGGAQ